MVPVLIYYACARGVDGRCCGIWAGDVYKTTTPLPDPRSQTLPQPTPHHNNPTSSSQPQPPTSNPQHPTQSPKCTSPSSPSS